MQDVFSISVSPPFFMLNYEMDIGAFVFFNCAFKCLVVLSVNLGGVLRAKVTTQVQRQLGYLNVISNVTVWASHCFSHLFVFYLELYTGAVAASV